MKNDIEINVSGKILDLTFEEAEVLLEKLYYIFKDEENNTEDYHFWEKEQGIPVVEFDDNDNYNDDYNEYEYDEWIATGNYYSEGI